ncbi:MAG: SprB repeat-containing protein, partial [Flavobacteriales bacterium]|nr:SprB repeat-containing protein [Flavobacteriales bacterium]
MKKVFPLLLFLLFWITFRAQAQPNAQDCLGAIAICQPIFAESNAYSGTGNVPNEINTATSCLGDGEKNDVWYTFTVQTSGDLCFTITPNLVSDDYDWAVYNLTTAACSDIFGNGSLEISCNFSSVTGATGPNGLTGDQNEACMSVSAGEIYVVNVSQFSSSPNGYTIDFSASSASIFDNTAPAILSVDNTPIGCGETNIVFSFSESVLCNTMNDGDITLSGPGGPFTVSGITGAVCAGGGTQEIQFSATISPAISTGGSYSLCLTSSSGVTDLCGNVSPAACLPFTVAGLTISTVSVTDVICFGASDGSATVSAAGGTGTLTYNWGTTPPQSGATATGLSGGLFQVTATDATGCSGVGSVAISQPVVIPDKFDVTCDSLGCDGSASVLPAGGTAPYSYQWYDETFNPIVGETSSSISNLCAGAWCVVVTDAAGCADTTCVSILLPALTLTPTLTSCIGACDGAVTLTAIGGVPPFTYQWQNPIGVPIPGETDSILSGLCTGTYYLDIQTGNACSILDSVVVAEPTTINTNINNFKDACFGACDGTATTTTSGGTSPYTYLWNDPDTQITGQATGLCAGTYQVLVSDANGCGPDTATVTIAQNPEIFTTVTVLNQNCDSVDGA